ncbi:hypothetical protein K437DRAFT_255021 [Tilletiaria anomala UBC 951]|uniref:HORMA domain-containing protein n=1 Tax=Tilletiaria anomala (strain ATCC 24038 / CBS 436.72 / UBC 951) TaxID=1037660 RepID=A0A066WIL7_TILAU|nr:uncharacterized protein K437DRAFT_255021 [Tilletiaria anomala UBC 951]KDN50849.1 hypothetical protein K437DRAFT_255021 [Tilletiaria anomala UBC 951]
MAQQQRVRPQVATANLITSTPKQDLAALTLQQSAAAVKTLVDTSLGCIMYLRGIFPEDHFEEVVLPSGRPMTTDESGKAVKMKGDGSIKVKKLKRGCSSEGDRLLDYWEKGVQDVLDKEYLKSLILAVSLDPDDPQNIVEAYTFNFKYESIQGTKRRAPIMELSARLRGIDMSGGGCFSLNADTEKNLPTAREVRASAQSIIRNLITMTQTLQELPRRRFITFKLIYNDTAPADYQPPFFDAADAANHRFMFGTKTLQQAPEESSFGTLETGHQSVSVHVASLADALPLPVVIDPDAGRNMISARTEVLQQEAILQKQDSDERCVVWDAEENAHGGLSDIEEVDEEPDTDADGEPGPDNHNSWLKQHQARLDRKKRVGFKRGFQPGVPVGVRLPNGKITPMPLAAVEEAAKREAARREGHTVAEDDLTDVEMFVSKVIRKEWDIETNTDLLHNVFSPRRYGSLQSTLQPHSSSPILRKANPTIQSQESKQLAPTNGQNVYQETVQATSQRENHLQQVPTRQAHSGQSRAPASSRGYLHGDVEMQNASPALPSDSQTDAVGISSQSVTQTGDQSHTHSQSQRTLRPRAGRAEKESLLNASLPKPNQSAVVSEDITRCACEDDDDDGLMIQCSSCSVWVHATCYGFRDTANVPDDFLCYADRIKALPPVASPAHIEGNDLIEDLQWLALKRRALHLMYITDRAWPDSVQKLAQKIGANIRMATKIRNELEQEGFLRKASPELDPHLFQRQRSVSHSQRKGRARPRKATTSQLVMVDTLPVKTSANALYFTPGLGKEREILEAPAKQRHNTGGADLSGEGSMSRRSDPHAATAEANSQEDLKCNHTLVLDSCDPASAEGMPEIQGIARLAAGVVNAGSGAARVTMILDKTAARNATPVLVGQSHESVAGQQVAATLPQHLPMMAEPSNSDANAQSAGACQLMAGIQDFIYKSPEILPTNIATTSQPSHTVSVPFKPIIPARKKGIPAKAQSGDGSAVTPISSARPADDSIVCPEATEHGIWSMKQISDEGVALENGSEGCRETIEKFIPPQNARHGDHLAANKRFAPTDFHWPGAIKKISIASAIEIQDESDFIDSL